MALVALTLQMMLLAQVAAWPNASPATQPAPSQDTTTTIVTTTEKPAGLLDAFNRSRLGQYAQGKKAVTWESLQEMRDPAFWIDSIKDLVLALLLLIPRLLIAALFLLIFYFLYRAIRKLVLGSLGRASVDNSIKEMLSSLIKWGVMGFGLIIACNQIGIQITALLAGVSVVGLAIGFAAQETLANFIAGIVIFWDKPFKVGDWLTVQDTFAQVLRVTFRSTRMLTLDGEVMVMPNTSMLSNKLINHSTHPLQRVNINVGIAYKESIDAARAVLLGLTTGDKRIVADPPPQVVVQECADSSVNLILRFWIQDESQDRPMAHEFLEKAKNALDKAEIQIPFPHRQVIVEESAALKSVMQRAA